MYEKITNIQKFEFGIYTSEGEIEVIAIDHETSFVRTLGVTYDRDDANFILETCIQYGFQEKGMAFERIPGFRLNCTPSSARLVEI
ncbi:hypothetical protein [Cytobacillus gottheilii]|uniref:hypothetical protein n=1 Tax=Cytobacillus gottheilii TaxID=859144 RepID=UPI0024958536|nr:hypothetical protein [Cytobacillus gottheilii]